MSAFIVSNEHIRVCVSALTDKPGTRGALLSRSTLWKDWTPADLGAALLALNVEAVSQRYPNDKRSLPGSRSRGYTHEQARVPATHDPRAKMIFQAKALDCLLYQCSEGDVPERAEYKELLRLRDWLYAQIVRDLPKYDQADAWDVPDPDQT